MVWKFTKKQPIEFKNNDNGDTSNPTDGVYFDMDGNGIKEKMTTWTDRNHNGLTDIGELEALGASGAIQTIKLNPYQTLLSGYDNNHDGEINSNDKLYNYLYIQTNADESVTLYLPDNAQAKEMIAGYTGGESIQTSQGEKIIKTILFYNDSIGFEDESVGTDGSETLEGSSRSETLRGRGGRDILDAGAGDEKTFAQLTNKITHLILQNYTSISSINHFKQDVLSQSLKKDIIINNFFIFKNTLYVEDIKNRNLLNEAA